MTTSANFEQLFSNPVEYRITKYHPIEYTYCILLYINPTISCSVAPSTVEYLKRPITAFVEGEGMLK